MSETTTASSYIPDEIEDVRHGVIYKKGDFYGKGVFANCFEITDTKTGDTFAAKIVSLRLLKKEDLKEKMTAEIKIHRKLNHRNVVKFHSCFFDKWNVYVVLELCRNRSLMELLENRKVVTEKEARFFVKQILTGVEYLHKNNIIHRDLKLGNLFLDDDFEVKIGDFGFAMEVSGEGIKSVCGTPNYMAPEILKRDCHSFEVDMWSIGCVMYSLLVGRAPFETGNVNDTFSLIKKCEYNIPDCVPRLAGDLIERLLQQDPKKRLTVGDALQHEWISRVRPSLPARITAVFNRLTCKKISRKREDRSVPTNVISVDTTGIKKRLEDVTQQLKDTL